MDFNDKIIEIKKNFVSDFNDIKDLNFLESLKVKYLGKKGFIKALYLELKDVSKEKKPQLGKELNDLKNEIESQFEDCSQKLINQKISEKLQKEKIDISIPGRKNFIGNYHPVTTIMNEMLNIFEGMGFSIEIGPDVDSDFYNFESLNFPLDHPSRDMQDTFYIDKNFLMRTHTTNIQVRLMESRSLPMKIASPGRCFRNETVSARSNVMFHQIDLFYIDKKVSFSDLMKLLDEFLFKLFKRNIETRYRPSYFPFVEPGLEVDIECISCQKKGCNACKHTGWLEVLGAGMIHPEIFKCAGIDVEEYSGYAVGIGIERLIMLLYKINDVRLFTQNDFRFLTQFNN